MDNYKDEGRELSPKDKVRLQELAWEIFEKLRMQGLSREEILFVIDEAARMRRERSVN